MRHTADQKAKAQERDEVLFQIEFNYTTLSKEKRAGRKSYAEWGSMSLETMKKIRAVLAEEESQ